MILGVDFMLDEHLQLSLLEINARPGIHQNLLFMESMFRDLITEAIDIITEVEIKRTCNESLGNLTSPRTWLPLWNEQAHPDRQGGCFKQRPSTADT
jgi:hypothetical protein